MSYSTSARVFWVLSAAALALGTTGCTPRVRLPRPADTTISPPSTTIPAITTASSGTAQPAKSHRCLCGGQGRGQSLRQPEDRIEAALSRKGSFRFVDTPLAGFVDYIREEYGINVVVDRRALDDAGVAADAPVSIALFDVSLRSALDLILRAIDLTWTVRSEAVLITTPEQADGILLTKVYGVADLVTFGNHQDQPPEGCDVLAETITSTVEPNSWEEAGGPGSIRGASAGTAKVLVIRQTYQVHRRIVRLLDQLQAAARSNVEDGPPPARKQHPRVGNDGVGSRE